MISLELGPPLEKAKWSAHIRASSSLWLAYLYRVWSGCSRRHSYLACPSRCGYPRHRV